MRSDWIWLNVRTWGGFNAFVCNSTALALASSSSVSLCSAGDRCYASQSIANCGCHGITSSMLRLVKSMWCQFFFEPKKRGQREVKVNMSQMFAVAVSRMFSNTSFCQPRGYGTEWLGGTLAYCQCESDIDGIAMHSIAVCWEEQWHDSMRAMPITQTIFILSWRYRTAKHLKHGVFAFQSWELDFRDLLAKGAARQELQGRHVLRVDKGNIL